MEETLYIRSNKYSTQERQTKRGRVYDVCFRVITKDGIEKQKKLSGFKTKGAAKEAYLAFTLKYCKWIKFAPRKETVPGLADAQTLSVNMLAPMYFQAIHNQIKDSTIYEKKKIFSLFLLPRFGDMDIRDITKQELYTWQDELWRMTNRKTGNYLSYKYLCKIRTYFSAFLSWCSERYETTNYLLQVRKPKKRTPKTEMRFWTRDEFMRFIQSVDDQTYRTLFMVLFFTGRRKGEVLSLSPADIDLSTRKIQFTKSLTRKTLTEQPYEITSTKADKKANTPICDTLLRELKSYAYDPNATFYFGGDAPLSDNTIRRAFNYYTQKAGLHQIRIHDLRHSFVSMLIHMGANPTVIADLIGDTLAQVTKTYAHLYEEDKSKIIAQIG